jgi:benzoate/toluate 1,2-dioxygenase reductase subunit
LANIQLPTLGEDLTSGDATVPTPTDITDAIQTAELLQRRWLSQNAFEIELTRPSSFAFKAGQTILFMHESFSRYYSLISTPDDPIIAFCVHLVRNGGFSPILGNAKIGSLFKFTGPHGYFTYKPSSRTPVFIATGTGIAPFVSFARSGVKDFILLHQAISADELYYKSDFIQITSKYFACLSEIAVKESSCPEAFCGKVSDCISKNLPAGSYDFYLCGDREMIQDVTLLADERYPGSFVFTEVFF